MKKRIKQFIEITIGVILIDIAYYFFYLPTGLVTGGTMGIAIIIKDYIPFDTSIFLYIIDGLLLLLGLLFLGKEFFVKTIFATILSPTVVLIFENCFDSNVFFSSSIQTPYFVSAVAGGIFTAVGLGLCFRNNGTTGGMDVVQKILSKYLHIPYSKTMYFTDGLVILIGGFFANALKYDIEMVIYGIITVIFIGYIVDYIALNARSRRTAYIVTTKVDEIRCMIYEKIDRGVTECDVKGGYTDIPRKMIICTMDKSESYKLGDYIKEIDPDAFTFITQTKEVLGNYDQIEAWRLKKPNRK